MRTRDLLPSLERKIKMLNYEVLEMLAKTVHECQPELPIIDYGRVITVSSVKPKNYDIVDCATFVKEVDKICNEKKGVFEDLIEHVINPTLESYVVKNVIECMGYNFIVRHNVNGLPYPAMIVQFEKNGIIEGFGRIVVVNNMFSIEVLPSNEKFALMISQNQESYENAQRIVKEIFSISMMINMILKDKPEHIVYETKRSTPSYNLHKSKKSKQKRKTLVQKVIKFDTEFVPDTDETVHSTHNITCPCWGVMGHWRTYKSGKRVWIKPHVRGKFRDAYETKEYQMP